eukprot:14007948-Alexandrium_andersonii.AAC.1
MPSTPSSTLTPRLARPPAQPCKRRPQAATCSRATTTSEWHSLAVARCQEPCSTQPSRASAPNCASAKATS